MHIADDDCPSECTITARKRSGASPNKAGLLIDRVLHNGEEKRNNRVERKRAGMPGTDAGPPLIADALSG